MKKVSVYSSDFEKHEDWLEFLEELEYDQGERDEIDEVELSVKSSSTSDQTIEEKLY